MPFSYYARLSRAQQAIYRRSDAITEIRLPQAERFAAAVDAVESALLAENRAATQAASERVIGGLMAFGLIGIFLGPTVLAVGYKLLGAWIAEAEPQQTQGASARGTSPHLGSSGNVGLNVG